jgi:hypothetical protein
MIAQVVAAGIGMWLMAAPAAIGYEGTAAADVDRILGPIAASIAIIAIFQATRNVRRANFLLAGLLLLAPFALGYPLAAAVNSVACGLIIGGLSFVRGRITKANGGGWRALIGD